MDTRCMDGKHHELEGNGDDPIIYTGANGSGTGSFGDCVGCEYAGSMDADSANTSDNAWFSFVMDAAGSATINVNADTDFPETIETTVYSDCDGSVADVAALDAGTYYVNVVQTISELGDVDFVISVDISILGCTDEGAANYNASATVDDESCEYIYGCTDNIAENYDEDATTDDGSCEYVLGVQMLKQQTLTLRLLKMMVHVSSSHVIRLSFTYFK